MRVPESPCAQIPWVSPPNSPRCSPNPLCCSRLSPELSPALRALPRSPQGRGRRPLGPHRLPGSLPSVLPQKIQQLSEGSMFGHGLKHLFHSRRRSREREQQQQNLPDSAPQPPPPASDHESPDEKERSPEMHRVSYAVSLHDLPARPTAFNRVLQQIRARPSIKRGASLHSGSRRAKSGSLEPQKGSSPHLGRKAPQDSGLAAILHQHQGRPRSSSTTDTAILLAEGGAVYLLAEDTEGLVDKVGMSSGGFSGERRVWRDLLALLNSPVDKVGMSTGGFSGGIF
uniref:Uncharacterized protein n=1 Tax=Malurus cyaneus samueli TaxID=2593467 RepID=A0A8C5TI31_9PASS